MVVSLHAERYAFLYSAAKNATKAVLCPDGPQPYDDIITHSWRNSCENTHSCENTPALCTMSTTYLLQHGKGQSFDTHVVLTQNQSKKQGQSIQF